ncbi:MAG: hypothetical protein IT458_11570 [Planctomycetes bacterium]|nr:hypothetical protein [Planctomycetota bacterium]
MRKTLSTVSLLLPALFLGCAKGEDTSRPTGEVKLAAEHHFFALTTEAKFAGFPVVATQTSSDRGILVMKDDSTYFVRRGTTESSSASYALSKNGQFSVLVTVASNQPDARYMGGYGLEGNTNHLFFADRYTTTSANRVGLFLGVRRLTASFDLAGEWHLCSQHVIFAGSSLPDPNNVARSAYGLIEVDSNRQITGTGSESSRANLTFTGSATTFADGALNLTLRYRDATGSDERAFLGAAGKNFVIALDADETDGETGLLMLVKKRTGTISLADLAGDYHVGLHTVFINPSNCGSDAAVGTLTLSDQGGFRLECEGARGVDFTYTGTFTAANDGKLVFTVSGTNETWTGAVDQDNKTIAVIDNFVEQRQNNLPELNFIVALRKVKV